jgi:hypothetical protein
MQRSVGASPRRARRSGSRIASRPESVTHPHPGPLSKRERRRRQLGVLRAFFLSTDARELQDAPIPSATTLGEITERKRELGFRLELLRAILDETRRELKALRRHSKRRR